MSNWCTLLVDEVRTAIQHDPFWEGYLAQSTSQNGVPFALHLAILVEPYLQFILDGRKTVESRFSARRRAPYQRVQRGDVVLLKRSSGPIVGLCQIADAWFYRLDPRSWETIRKEFTEALCAQDPAFWKTRRHASFATLMRLHHVQSITPMTCAKRDRRGWVILQQPCSQLSLLGVRKPIVIAFAGSIASGKSTLSMGVAKALGWSRVGFGDYVRHVARSQGLDSSREVLQEVGATLIDQGWEEFCRAVLRQVDWKPGQPLIVDGIRHIEAVEMLRQLVAPSELLIVFIAVDGLTRKARLRQRGTTDHEHLQRVDTHPTEAQVQTVLPSVADLTVDGTQPMDDLLPKIMLWVQQRVLTI